MALSGRGLPASTRPLVIARAPLYVAAFPDIARPVGTGFMHEGHETP